MKDNGRAEDRITAGWFTLVSPDPNYNYYQKSQWKGLNSLFSLKKHDALYSLKVER
jgi:hypothetical protein